MAKVISLRDYRKGKRRDYIERHEARVSKFIDRFLASRLFEEFIHAAHGYITQHMDPQQVSWDYVTLRETLQTAMTATIAKELMTQLRGEFWYDEKWMSEEEVVDRTISAFVLGTKGNQKSRVKVT